MNIDNLNPENNNGNVGMPNQGPAPIPPVNPVPPVGPATPGVVSPVSPAPTPDAVPPVSPMPANPGVVPSVSPTPVPPVSPNPEPINLQPEGIANEVPVAERPEPLMGATLTANTPLVNQEPVKPEPLENFNTNNTISENPPTFGGVPTPPNAPILSDAIPAKPSKKKGGKKSLIIILVFILVLGVGAGLYYFLNIANTSKVVVNPILTDWELGTPLTDNASDYANISGVDPSTCKVDNSAINVYIMNTYAYSVSCPGVDEVKATLRVRDTKGPNVVLKDMVVKPNTTVLVDDFVSDCSDVSLTNGCDVTISDSSIDLDELVKEAGDYEIPLSIKDDFNNETLMTAKLTVDENAPSLFLQCEVSKEFETETMAAVQQSYEYGINDQNEVSTVKKTLIYQFESVEAFTSAKDKYDSEGKLDGLSGNVLFDEENLRIKLEINVDVANLKTELNASNDLKTYEDVAIYHETANDFCSLS